MRNAIFVLLVTSLGACTYNADAPVSPAYDVYSNYNDKVPGKYALFVDASEMKGEYKVQGFACSAHSYSQDAAGAFEQSSLKTFQNLVESVQQVDRPLSRTDLEARDLDAQIVVEAEDMDVRINVIPGFWTSDMEADVELAAGLTVDGREGRLLGTTVAADEDATTGAGTGCDGGAKALSMATSDALEELMQRLGERLTNSRRLRDAMTEDRQSDDGANDGEGEV